LDGVWHAFANERGLIAGTAFHYCVSRPLLYFSQNTPATAERCGCHGDRSGDVRRYDNGSVNFVYEDLNTVYANDRLNGYPPMIELQEKSG